MPDHGVQNEDDTSLQRSISLQEDKEASTFTLNLPKNRSTGNLFGSSGKNATNARIRLSFNEETIKEHSRGTLSPIMSDHEHGVGASGLRRIRQQPLSRMPTQPPSPQTSFSLPPRSSSMTLASSTSRGATPNTFTSAGPSSPTFNFTEDLSRFPSESLHSFSFAHQSEDALHSRQNILKRSLDFMRSRLVWTTDHPGLVTAQARVTGDPEIQRVMELLTKANLLGHDTEGDRDKRALYGPLTGPPNLDGSNVFDKAFVPAPRNIEIAHSKIPDTLQNQDSIAPPMADHSGLPSSTDGASGMQDPQSSEARSGLKRTRTDLSLLNLQTKLTEVMARPYTAKDNKEDDIALSPTPFSATGNSLNAAINLPSVVHGSTNRWSQPSQAIFTTEAHAPWTILAANDLACLVFGVTKAEVKKLGILEVVREEGRVWLESKLRSTRSDVTAQVRQEPLSSRNTSPNTSSPLTSRGGVTAKLLSKPPSRQVSSQNKPKKGSSEANQPVNGTTSHNAASSRGVLLCGDVVPIQKRNGATGSASLWVKEKRGGLIWVLEEIAEDMAILSIDREAHVVGCTGPAGLIWGESTSLVGADVRELVPKLPLANASMKSAIDFTAVQETRYYTAQNADGTSIPVSVSPQFAEMNLRVSSFPHIAGILVLSASTLEISSSNSVFSAALFGQANPNGLMINELIPCFDRILKVLTEDSSIILQDGIVIPEQSFRRASGLLALREGTAEAATLLLPSAGLIARHRDGSDIRIDVQMRVVHSERASLNDAMIEKKK